MAGDCPLAGPANIAYHHEVWQEYTEHLMGIMRHRLAAGIRNYYPQMGAVIMTSEAEIEAKIKEKRLTGPRITPGHIDDLIVKEQYHVFDGTTVTVCALTLFNGYVVVGTSAAISPENFDTDLGRDIARADARDKIWPLEGYLLKDREHNRKGRHEIHG